MPKIVDVRFDLGSVFSPINRGIVGEYLFVGNRAYDISKGYAPISGAFEPNLSCPYCPEVNTPNLARVGGDFEYTGNYSRDLGWGENYIVYFQPFNLKVGRSKVSTFIPVKDDDYVVYTNAGGLYNKIERTGNLFVTKNVGSVPYQGSVDASYRLSLFFKDSSNNYHLLGSRISYYGYYKRFYIYYDVVSLVNGNLKVSGKNSSATFTTYNYSLVPIFITETDSFAYFYATTIASPFKTIIRLDKSTGVRTLLNLQSRDNSVASIASYISKPEDNGDGTFGWYKVVMDTEQEDKPLVIKRYTFNSSDESFVIEDCDIDGAVISYDNNGYSHPFQTFNLETVTVNGKKYLYLFVFNMFNILKNTSNYDKYKLQDSAVKVYLWEIGADGKTLTFKGTKNFPRPDIHYVDFLDRDNPDKGIILVAPDEIFNISLTGEDGIYNVNWSYSTPFNPYLASYYPETNGISSISYDNYGNLFISTNIVKTQCYLIGDKILENITINFEKDDYSNDQLPINTYVTVSAVNYKGDIVPTRVGLFIRSDNAYWKDNNSKYIEVDVTAPTNVNLTITDRGKVYVEAKAIKGL